MANCEKVNCERENSEKVNSEKENSGMVCLENCGNLLSINLSSKCFLKVPGDGVAIAQHIEHGAGRLSQYYSTLKLLNAGARFTCIVHRALGVVPPYDPKFARINKENIFTKAE